MKQEKIGKFISKLRKEKEMTQEEFAEKIGVSNKTISRWETGLSIPDLSLFDSICEELGITINELLSGEKLKKEEYQKEFEKNVIEVVQTVNKKTRVYTNLTNIFLGFIIFCIIAFLSIIFFTNYSFKEDYNKDSMIIIQEIIEGEESLMFRTNNSSQIKYIFLNAGINDEELGLVFLTAYRTLSQKIQDSISYSKYGGYDLTNSYNQGTKLFLKGTNLEENFKVYYTSFSFSQIEKATSKELIEIIENSYLMYESNVNN